MIDTLVYLDKHFRSRTRKAASSLWKEMVAWLRENNVKYSLYHSEHGNPLPNGLYISSEDALMFRLKFGI